LLSSFLVVFTTILLAMLSLLIWPFRTLWRVLTRRTPPKPWAKRLIVLGFDGQDAKVTERFIAEGKLPNFKKLQDMGCYSRLRTTYPSITPAAWSTFSTGTPPAKHGIFDFLDRDPRSYMPMLSSVRMGRVERFLKIGKLRIPLHKPELRLMRKSKAFWSILGERNVWSTILRMPITFPPESFHGAQLSAACTPDLLGTQGTFLLFTTRPAKGRFKEGGLRVELSGNGNGRYESAIQGPENMFKEGSPPLEIPLTIERDRESQKTRIDAGGTRVELPTGQLSPWLALTFKAAPGVKVSGLCRMLVTEADEHFSLYVSPLSLDPEKPAMPISHPSYYATYLAKMIGPYSTLGLAEDTWALNEGVIDDDTFLKLTYDVDREREQMFFKAFDRLRTGSLACVFDATDRVQHMFWRYTESGHPAAKNGNGKHADAIEQIYKRNDELVGRVLDRLKPGDVFMAVSDHGMTSFQRGCNINAWLYKNGYLALKEGTDGSTEWLRDVDWSRTKAYVVGLTGIFLNIKGREAEGVVEPGEEARALKAELVEKLSGMVDEDRGDRAINDLFETAKLYSGPYLGRAPDLLVGYNTGYRHSWDCASGVVSGPVFEDNVKAWSADHCVDPRLVPGVLFCNYAVDNEDPSLLDMAPTALKLFGLEPASHMEGQPLFHEDPLTRKSN
jgi:predicted AlkP superfamily phosphohydrolase/phosphomutase